MDKIAVEFKSSDEEGWVVSILSGISLAELKQALLGGAKCNVISPNTYYRAYVKGRDECLCFKRIVSSTGNGIVSVWKTTMVRSNNGHLNDTVMSIFEDDDSFLSCLAPPKPVYQPINLELALAEAVQGKEVFYKHRDQAEQDPKCKLVWAPEGLEFRLTTPHDTTIHWSLVILQNYYIFSRKVSK